MIILPLRRSMLAALLLTLLLNPALMHSGFAQVSPPAPLPVSSVPLNQPLRFERLTLEDGLSQNTVFALLQDRQGFIWAATQDGLNRYDGYDFTVFKHDPQDANSLSLSSVTSLYQDRDGLLWIGTWGGGLDRFDPRTGQFTHYRADPVVPTSLSHDVVTSILEDSLGRLWVGTCGGGLNLLDRAAGQFTHYRSNPGSSAALNSDNISTILEDRSGSLWLGTGCFGANGAGLDRFDPLTGSVIRFQHDPDDPNSLSGDNVSALAQDGSGALWVATGGYTLHGAGLNRLDPQTGVFTRYQFDPSDPNSLSSNDLMSLMVDSSGLLWVGSWEGGLNLADIRGLQASSGTSSSSLQFHHYRNNPYNSQSLSSNVVWSFLEDRSGLFWVGTANGGLNKLNPQVQRFGLYRNDPGNPQSLSYNAVGPVLEDRLGRVWVATLGRGIDQFNPRTGQFRHFEQPQDVSIGQHANAFLTLYEDRRGAIWTGTLAGLGLFNPDTGQVRLYQHDLANPDSLINDNVTSILEDKAGRLWVGTLGGLDWFDREKERFIHLQIPELVSVFTLYLDRDGGVWLGSWGQGLFRLDPATLSEDRVDYQIYQHNPGEPASLADDGVFTILQDRSGKLWFGTQAGLDRLDAASQTFTHFQESDGLSNNTILCMLEDRQGFLWISTNDGLSRFDPRQLVFRSFHAQDGLQSDEFNSGACGMSRSGELYFGGQNGLNVFRPEQIQDNPLPPPVALTTFRVFNEPVQVDLSGQSPIQLSYSENFIAFEFVALDFHAPQNNRYAYMLEGFDNEWVQAGTRRYASYTNLGGGDYVFRVRATNNDGVWSEIGAAMPIHVTPPVWGALWFRLVGVLFLAGVVAGGVRLRLESIRAQNRRLEALVAKATAELSQSNQMLEVEVDQRKRAEAALADRAARELQQSEARFRAVFENSVVGMDFLSLDRRIIESNPAIEALTGYSRTEMVGLNPTSLVFEADRLLDVDQFQQMIDGQLDGYVFEKRYIRKDGSLFWGRLNYTLVRDESGGPHFIFGILEDIDDEKRAQDELRRSEARFRAMFDNAAVGMSLMTLERRVIEMNQTAERIIGYSLEEIRKINPVTLALPEDRDQDSRLYQEMVAGRRDQYMVERRYLHKNGGVFWGRVTYSLVRDEQNRPQYLISLIEDIDEEKRANERLANQEAEYRRTLEQRVAERTIELSQANLQLQQAIQQRQRVEAELAQKAAEVAVVAERNRLARDLHDAVTQTLFSASLVAEVLPQLWEINQVEARKRLKELRELTRGALAEMRTLLLELRPSALTDAALPDLLRQLTEAVVGRARLPISLIVEGSCSLPPEIQVAFYRIAQEALNNVAKYARASQVGVNLRLAENSSRLTVIDDGVGFDLENIPPNHLGLRIMRERAEAIGARLSIYSEPGEGTQVTVVWNREPSAG